MILQADLLYIYLFIIYKLIYYKHFFENGGTVDNRKVFANKLLQKKSSEKDLWFISPLCQCTAGPNMCLSLLKPVCFAFSSNITEKKSMRARRFHFKNELFSAQTLKPVCSHAQNKHGTGTNLKRKWSSKFGSYSLTKYN